MPLSDYRVTLLITHTDNSEEIRVVHQEAWNADQAWRLAVERALEEEDVASVESEGVS